MELILRKVFSKVMFFHLDWLYAMTVHPFLQELQNLLGAHGFVQFFVDDGNLAGDFDYILPALQYIIQEGPK